MGRQRRPRHHRSVVVCSDRQPLFQSSVSGRPSSIRASAIPTGRFRPGYRQSQQAAVDPRVGVGRVQSGELRRFGTTLGASSLRKLGASTLKGLRLRLAALADCSRRGSYETALDGLLPADRAGSSRRETYGCRIGFAVEKPAMAVSVEESFIGRYDWRELRMTVTVEELQCDAQTKRYIMTALPKCF